MPASLNDHEYRKFRETNRGDAVAVVGLNGNDLSSPLESYSFCFADESGTTTYVGLEDKDADWAIMKIDESTGTVATYATEINNPSITNITDARTSETSLTYQLPNQVF